MNSEDASNQIFEIIEEKLVGKPIHIKLFPMIMEQNNYSVCKIEKKYKSKEKACGTGFLCIIPFPDRLTQMTVLITCNHVLSNEDVKVGKTIILKFGDKYAKTLYIDEARKVYTSLKSKYDITMIEIRRNDGFNLNKILEIDNDVNDLYSVENLNDKYKNESIYIIQYPNGANSFSMGVIKGIDSNNDFMEHSCPTDNGSSGSPIINSNTFKVIGIHSGRGKTQDINFGLILKKPIIVFYNNFNNRLKKENSYISIKTVDTLETERSYRKKSIDFSDFKKNEINLKIKIFQKEINKKVYFLDNTNFTDWVTKKKHYHDALTELNESNTKVYINNKEEKYKKYFIPKKSGIYDIKIVVSIKMTDCSYMFSDCANILSIDLSSFDSSNVTRLDHMFYECYLLTSINFKYFDTNKVTDMCFMFLKCKKLEELDLSSFNINHTEKVEKNNENYKYDMFYDMFLDCTELKSVNFNKNSYYKIKDKIKLKKNVNIIIDNN